MKRESFEGFASRLTRLEITTYVVDTIPQSHVSGKAGLAAITERLDARAAALEARMGGRSSEGSAAREEGVADEGEGPSKGPPKLPGPGKSADGGKKRSMSEAKRRLEEARARMRDAPREEGVDEPWSDEDERLMGYAAALSEVADDPDRLEQDEAASMAAEKVLTVALLDDPVVAARTFVSLDGDVKTILARDQLAEPAIVQLHSEMVKVSTGFWADLVRAIASFLGNLVKSASSGPRG